MATIKSYTDLEQSKKLAEILPPESADMHYVLIDSEKDLYSAGLDKYIGILPHHPAWSLAALLGVLPRFIEYKGDKYYLRFMKEYVEYANDEISITGRCLHTTGNDNLVDACYEMLIKLHELKMM